MQYVRCFQEPAIMPHTVQAFSFFITYAIHWIKISLLNATNVTTFSKHRENDHENSCSVRSLVISWERPKKRYWTKQGYTFSFYQVLSDRVLYKVLSEMAGKSILSSIYFQKQNKQKNPSKNPLNLSLKCEDESLLISENVTAFLKKLMLIKYFENLTEMVPKLLFFNLFLATPCGMSDSSSQTRDQTHIPCIGSWKS